MTSIDPDNLPLERLQYWERTRADDVWLVQPTGGGEIRRFTWREALDEARRVAAYLRALDLPRGSNIAILSKNCAHWILADFAIWLSGHVSVPLYPTLGAESVRQVLTHSEAAALFVGKLDAWEQMRDGVPPHVRRIGLPYLSGAQFDGVKWDDIVRDTAPLAEHVTRAADELGTIVYTSGTTGDPKGVMLTFGALGWCVEPVFDLIALGPGDRMISYLPLSHVAERGYVEMLSVRAGFTVYFGESLDTFVADLQRARPTFFISVPRLWAKFRHAAASRLPPGPIPDAMKPMILQQLGLDRVRLAASAAAAIEPALLTWYRDLGLELLEGYGMSELCGVSHSCRQHDMRPGYVGAPVRDVESRLADTGEIEIRSPGNTIGYYKRPDLTAALFTPDGFIRSGDLGELDEAGRLKITGRVKEIFKTSKGKYVAPSPIESRLTTHPLVDACCVVGAGRPQPCALVSLSDEGRRLDDDGRRAALATSLGEHLERVNASLDDHEKLRFVVVVDSIWNETSGFVTPTFKVRRNRVEARYAPFLDAWDARGAAVVWESDAA
ncbi:MULTISPECIES: AMP-binding protein [Burkholderia]|uniref:AMP-binding acetyl-CoA synthetase n=1 Tax=Burkholderia savannae TaxID=1637837 RepID=A0ABR5T2H0_9BURK|nr:MULTISPECIES: AMP-binding protein [Burkholderia]AOJ72836.1 AMP-binding acetyl-CoA synthetase [Burkholderia savannae]AOJ84631.1 AMP-binding acetyl-CoA synthetase [Burkholderia savannae]KVG44934.1 AMP-binding acetyl-CoA synthetase [Burkholderia sp. MSMB0265]KVG89922.1 AMP-binding acetyl-CoA synthetase [Burkholderia sp. MSMB2040]KVG96059.1 AMP-binding acetyl-CoA synthetase [Burkholderia sp. MSMB2041]